MSATGCVASSVMFNVHHAHDMMKGIHVSFMTDEWQYRASHIGHSRLAPFITSLALRCAAKYVIMSDLSVSIGMQNRSLTPSPLCHQVSLLSGAAVQSHTVSEVLQHHQRHRPTGGKAGRAQVRTRTLQGGLCGWGGDGEEGRLMSPSINGISQLDGRVCELGRGGVRRLFGADPRVRFSTLQSGSEGTAGRR